MGFDLSNWDEVTGAMYMGANSSWEFTWFAVSAGLCIFALIVGASHEKDAYRRSEGRRSTD